MPSGFPVQTALGVGWPRTPFAAGLLAAAALAVGFLPPLPAQAAACPAAATDLVSGFYRWYLAHPDHYREAIASQAQRFTPLLLSRLVRGFQRRPEDGSFIDFDPFSNSQASAFGFRLQECRAGAQGTLVLRVAVRAGLRPASASSVPLDYLLVPRTGGWQISDIRYPSSDNFSLSTFLQGLLTPAR